MNQSGKLKGYTTPRIDAPVRLQLSRNESPASSDLISRISSFAESRWEIGRYPEPTGLQIAIGSSLGIDAARIVVTAGGDEAIDRMIRWSFRSGRNRVAIHSPSFEMFDIHSGNAGGRMITTDWFEGVFPVGAFCQSIDETIALAVCVTPNNPTGSSIPLQMLMEIAEHCSRQQVPLLVDLAYTEFVDESPADSLAKMPGVFTVRTFSKAWGMAAIRTGYLVAPDAATAGELRSLGGPFPVAGHSLALAIAALKLAADTPALSRERMKLNRSRTAMWIKSMGGELLPASESNFILARFPEAPTTWQRLAEQGVLVRVFPGREILSGWLRITCPTSESDFELLNQLTGTCI